MLLRVLILSSICTQIFCHPNIIKFEDVIDNGAGDLTEDYHHHQHHEESPREGELARSSVYHRIVKPDKTVVKENSARDPKRAEAKRSETPRQTRFEPNWPSLDTRILPQWYDDAKFGIIMHWGVYSVPAFYGEWLWWHWKGGDIYPYLIEHMKEFFPGYSYQDLAPLLTAKYFNATEFANIVEDSGAKYFVFTSKHHEGFTNWKSDQSWNWNSVDVGPKRDIIGELRDAFTKKDAVKFGLYFSLYEWFNPMYLQDKKNGFKTNKFVTNKVTPQLMELVNKYKPHYIWSDGDWETTSEYWNSTQFLAWLYNDSPVKDDVLVNDRWGQDAMCKHGDVKTCADRFQPGKNVSFKWENAMTIDKESWGYRQNANISSYYTTSELVRILIETVSYGGNLLMNVGPTYDGLIMPIFQDRLHGMGKWLKTNGESIYGTRKWRIPQDTDEQGKKKSIWYTSKGNTVYAFIVEWPADEYLILRAPKSRDNTSVSLIGCDEKITWEPLSNSKNGSGIKITINKIHLGSLMKQNAWVFRMDNVE